MKTGRPDEKHPTCLQCGRRLRKHTERFVVAESDRPYKAGGRIGSRRVWGVVKTTLHRPAGSIVQWLWMGCWGYKGNNYFCGPACGYAWAVDQLRKSHLEVPDGRDDSSNPEHIDTRSIGDCGRKLAELVPQVHGRSAPSLDRAEAVDADGAEPAE